MTRDLASLASGLLFGLGLAVSQMMNPAKVFGFLDVAGAWDPSLALVMIGGQTLVMVSARRSATRRSAAFLLLNPITAAALGVLLLDEVLSTGQVVGAAFVLTGMALASGVGNLRSRGSRGSRDAGESSG